MLRKSLVARLNHLFLTTAAPGIDEGLTCRRTYWHTGIYITSPWRILADQSNHMHGCKHTLASQENLGKS